jgi:RND family efflux transporter MFP subunit
MQRNRIVYEAAKREYERALPLVKNRIVSEKEFNRIKQNYESARIGYEVLARSHSGGGQLVVAPITGFVKNILVKAGDYVEVGRPLATITQDQRLQLRAEVSERHHRQLSQIVSANFKTPYSEQLYSLQRLKGKLLSVGKSGSENAYVPVTFEFNNQGDLLSGSFVEVYLLTAAKEKALSIPLSAVTEEQGLYFVYIRLAEERYKKLEVTLGQDNGERIEVLSGLQADQQVVVSGAHQLKLASAASVIPTHTHEH